MGVRKDDVFDLAGIETKLLHAANDLVLRCVIEQSFEDDGALAADDRPRVVDFGAEEVKVVCNLCRLCIPGIPRRSSRGGRGRRWGSSWGTSRYSWRWRNAEAKE